jgi:hypothetical protein
MTVTIVQLPLGTPHLYRHYQRGAIALIGIPLPAELETPEDNGRCCIRSHPHFDLAARYR